MKTYFIYILLCSDELLYTGFTNNIQRRFKEHQEGLNYLDTSMGGINMSLLCKPNFHQLKGRGVKPNRFLPSQEFIKILSECRNFTHSKYKPTKEEVSTALDQTYKIY